MTRKESVHGRAVVRWATARLLLAGTLLMCVSCGSELITGGKLHFEDGRFEKAAEVFQQAVARNPRDATAHFWLGRSYCELDKVTDGTAEFDRAVALDSQFGPPIDAERHRYWRRFYGRGEALLREALAMDRRSAQRADRLQSAASPLDEARQLLPEEGLTYYQLYRLAVARGDSSSAEDQFQKAAEHAVGNRELATELVPLLKDRGKKAVRDQRYADAVTSYRLAAQLRPDDLDLAVDLASAHLLLAEAEATAPDGRLAGYREAGTILERVHRLRPTDPDALFNLATVRARTGQPEEADSLVHAYLAFRPRDGEAWELLETVATALKHGGEAEAADAAGRVLTSGNAVKDPAGWSRRSAERAGAASAAAKTLVEIGPPEQIVAATENSVRTEIWIYAAKRRAIVLREGQIIGVPVRLEGAAP